MILYVIASTPIGLILGLIAGRFFLPFIQALFIFPAFYRLLSRNRWRDTLAAVFLWAFLCALLVGGMSLYFTDWMRDRILFGANYRQEMFDWIRTGTGRESDVRQFLPQHLLHFVLFALLTSLSGGFLGLVMGAVLMNYMSFYVGAILTQSQNTVLVLLLSWPPWAIIRVIGYVLTATSLTGFIYKRLPAREVDGARIRLYLRAGLVLVALDVLLKWLLAPTWQRWLQSYTHL